MFEHDGEVMDFGEDDDGATQEFLTGKLAALGIDEDLELSGEEEYENPSGCAKCVGPAAPPKRSCSPDRACEATTQAEGPMTIERNQASAANSQKHSSSPSVAVVRATNTAALEQGAVEEGEMLEMLNKPLQTSRGRLQGPRCVAFLDSGGPGGKRGRSRRGKERPSYRNGKEEGRKLTIKECATWVCKRLDEPKYYLMCQVVTVIGYNNSKRLLGRVQQIQEAGGMPTADGTRKRTPGGVFFTLLKEHMEPAKLKELYADELRVKKEKERMRRAAMKRRTAAADAGEDVSMPPRDPPRNRGGTSRRNMGAWAGPPDADVTAKRARKNQVLGEERG